MYHEGLSEALFHWILSLFVIQNDPINGWQLYCLPLSMLGRGGFPLASALRRATYSHARIPYCSLFSGPDVTVPQDPSSTAHTRAAAPQSIFSSLKLVSRKGSHGPCPVILLWARGKGVCGCCESRLGGGREGREPPLSAPAYCKHCFFPHSFSMPIL